MPKSAKISSRVYCYEAGRRIPKHAHSETQVTLLISGQIQEVVNCNAKTIRALDVIVKPSGTEHENEFGSSESVSLQISIPKTITTDMRSIGNGFASWQQKLNPFLVSRFLDLAEQLCQRKKCGTELSLAAFRLHELAKRLTVRDRRASGNLPNWLKTALRILDCEFRQPLTVNELAMRCDIHPVSLNRAYQHAFGESISQRKAMLRTQHAASLLANKQNSLAAIALDCGFVDQSHLNRVFKSMTGRTPGQYRQITHRLANISK